MPIFILSILIQLGLVIHIIKTGRNTTWIWVVVALPLVGSLAYLIIELLPDMANTKTGRKARRKIEAVVNPEREIKEAAFAYSALDSVENTSKLAEGLLNTRDFEQAKTLYLKCLKGIHEHDAYLLYGLAKAEFGLNNYAAVKELLELLIKHNPEFKNPDAHLLYARALEKLKNIDSALHEYETLHGYFPGPEASYHYAKLLMSLNKEEQAQAVLATIIQKAKFSGSHYNDIHQQWIKLAQKNYRVE